MVTLADLSLGTSARVRAVDGPRAFRRRLLEMGLVPGTDVKIVTVAPLGDPLQIEVRGANGRSRDFIVSDGTESRTISYFDNTQTTSTALTTAAKTGSAQVSTVNVGGTIEEGDIFTITVEGQSFSYTATKNYHGKRCFGTPIFTKRGKYRVRAHFEGKGVFGNSNDWTHFRVTR